MNVLVVAEYYPRAGDPVLGVWAHRQALAARDAGAEVRVLVLHRPIPPLAKLRARELREALRTVRQPRSTELDGLRVEYMPYLSPPRPWSYSSWGLWAAPALFLALRRVRRHFPYDLIHAHYAVPAADAVRRAASSAPLVVSVHSHDVLGGGGAAARRALAHARLVIANAGGTARRVAYQGARDVRVVHLGTDVPVAPARRLRNPTLVTVAHLIARKRHEDVISALALLRDRRPALRYVVVGNGPERERLRRHALALGVGELVEFRGQLQHAEAVADARTAWLFVMPSVDETFGVAYLEAMAGGVPAIGCRGEDGPEEIAAAGGGIDLVAPRDPNALAERIDALLGDPAALTELGRQARETVQRAFTWERCGRATVEAYEAVLATAR